MARDLLLLCICCATIVTSQILRAPLHFYSRSYNLRDSIIPTDSMHNYRLFVPLKRSTVADENLETSSDREANALIGLNHGQKLIVRRTQLTQLNRLLKKPIFNFANLFRRI